MVITHHYLNAVLFFEKVRKVRKGSKGSEGRDALERATTPKSGPKGSKGSFDKAYLGPILGRFWPVYGPFFGLLLGFMRSPVVLGAPPDQY